MTPGTEFQPSVTTTIICSDMLVGRASPLRLAPRAATGEGALETPRVWQPTTPSIRSITARRRIPGKTPGQVGPELRPGRANVRVARLRQALAVHPGLRSQGQDRIARALCRGSGSGSARVSLLEPNGSRMSRRARSSSEGRRPLPLAWQW
jgi:hypothetical protein